MLWFEYIKYRETNTHSLCFIAEEVTAKGWYAHAKRILSEHTASGENILSMRSQKRRDKNKKISVQFHSNLTPA